MIILVFLKIALTSFVKNGLEGASTVGTMYQSTKRIEK